MSPSQKKTAKPARQTSKPAPRQPASATFFKRYQLHIVLLALVFVVFGNGIWNGYALDDEFYTAGSNQLTQKGIKGIPEIFTTRTFYNNDGSGYSYRPVALTSFALEIQFFGERPHVSHFINVLIYAFTLILLFGILRKWFAKQGDWFAFFVTLVFLVHPIHTEVVDNIKCRDELLAFFFSLCTIRFIWHQIETGEKWAWLAAAVSFAFGVLSKTSVAPMVVLIPFSVWYFTQKKWWQALLYVGPLVVGVLIIRLLLIRHLPETSRTLQGFENPAHDMHFSQLSATAMYVLGRYLYLLVIPHPLIFYYGLNEVPVGSWSNPMIILSAITYIALLVWTWIEFRRKSIAGFGLIFFLVNIVLFSNLFGAAPGLMAERFAYAASLGFIIAAVDLLFRATKINPAAFKWKTESATKMKLIVIGLVAVFALRSMIRNEAWEDKETLYRNDVELAPESAKINMLLGSLLSSQAAKLNFEAQQHFNYYRQLMAMGRQQEALPHRDSASQMRTEATGLFEESRTYYRKATEIFPDYYTAWSNLGTAYYFLKDYRGGIPYFKRAIAIKRDYAEAYFNLGMSYEQMSMNEKGMVTDSALLDSSVYYFRHGLTEDPKYVNSAEQLSRILNQRLNDSVGAVTMLHDIAEKNPKSAVPWNALGNVYLVRGDTITAVGMIETAAKIDQTVSQENIQRYMNLANYFNIKGDAKKASDYSSLAQAMQAEYDKKQRMIGKNKRR